MNAETIGSNLRWLLKTSGVAALLTGILLLIGVISPIKVALQPDTLNGWSASIPDNWLIVIFKLHAGFSGVQIESLHDLNLLDIAILALVSMTLLGLYAALRKTSRIGAAIALALPLLGIVLFIATKLAGRSAVMGAVLVISFVMLRNDRFNKAIAYIGILAGVLLLAGDFSASVLHSNLITTLFGIGYLLLITWFFLIARRLFQLSPDDLEEEGNKPPQKTQGDEA